MGFAKMCGPGRTLEILLSKHKFKSHIGDYSKVLQTLQMLVLASKFDIKQCDRGSCISHKTPNVQVFGS